jgi:peptidoglycan/xylan/chitin deacetylase (PgdA/CDA1 family)
MSSIPVLMYHHVLSREGFIASSIENFEKQMKFLSDNGWKTLTSNEFYLYKMGKLTLPNKSVLITFDDGWRDNYIYAYPILKKYALKATLFVVTEWIEQASNAKEYSYEEKNHKMCKKIVPTHPRAVICTWEELVKMKDVFDIQSHTHTHRDTYFGELPWIEEFETSKHILQDKMNIMSKHLCWPRGKYDHTLIKRAISSNFEVLYTTKRGINRADGNLTEIRRIAVKKDDKWLKKNLFIFSNTFLGKLYSWIKPV